METCNTLHSASLPFSPIFDCKSRQRSNCLNKLKDSIDKRQGLILAVGEDGVGKTILCQELARKFAEDHTIESLLILEPHFQTEKEFASCLGQLFGSFSPKADASDDKFIEEIKKYLFTQCAAQKKSMLILINRGEELPDFCWRFIEELYKNYNDARKLLQIVIFGSPKIKETVVSFRDLSANVNGYCSVEPMTVSEARQLIRLWRQHAGQAESGAISFTLSAQWLIYLVAQGYPGRILDLCDLIRLTLSLHNTRKADWYITQMCARMLYPARAAKLQRIRLASLTAVLAIAVVYGLNTDMIARPVIGPKFKSTTPIVRQSISPQPAMQQKSSTSAPSREMASAPPSAAPALPDMNNQDLKSENRASKPAHPETQPPVKTPVKKALEAPENVRESQPVETLGTKETTEQSPTVREEAEDAIEEDNSVNPLGPTELLGAITVREKETLYDMTRKLYGPYQGNQQQARIAAVLRFNPALSSASRIQIGDSVRFPALPVMLPPDADKQWWLQLAAFADLGEAYRFVRRHANTPPMVIIPTLKSKRELRFTIILQEYFTDKDSARQTGKMLTPAIFPEVSVLDGLPEHTYYYERTKESPLVGRKTTAVATPPLRRIQPTGGKKILPARQPASAVLSDGVSTKYSTAQGIKPSDIIGTITVREKETLYDMTRKLYGPYQGNQQQARIAAVLRFNPALSSASRIQIGDSIRFPALPVMLPPDADKQWWLQLAAFADLGEAYRFVRRHANTPPMLIIPALKSKRELRFTIILQEYFTDKNSARKTGKRLTPATFPETKILAGLDPQKYYYAVRDTIAGP